VLVVVVQVVYKANKLASLIKKKEKYEGKIEFLLKKQAAEPTSDRPTMKVKANGQNVTSFLSSHMLPSGSIGQA
jgi:hypothetical protein